MGQALTTTGTKAVDAGLPARVDALYALIGRDERRRCDTLPAPIDYATQVKLSEYRVNLHSRLRPISEAVAERDKAGAAIGVFLQGYPNMRAPDPKATVRSYLAQLMDQPLFAILAALDDFRNRRVFDIGSEGEKIPFTIDHAPTAPRLLDQVKKCAGPVLEERHKVIRLLSITKYADPELSEEMRQKVAMLMQNLASGLAKGAAAEKAREIEKIRAEADEARERAKRITENARRRRIADDLASQDRAAAEANAG